MSLASFQESLAEFVEPWRSLVQVMCERWDDYPNAVVLGEYPGDEQVIMDAWTVVGLAPESLNLTHVFMECHLMTGTMDEKPKWISQLREVASGFSVPHQFAGLNPALIGGMVQAKLGPSDFHVVGMISLHRTVKSNNDFAVLWMHPQLNRAVVEYVMKIVLNERLK